MVLVIATYCLIYPYQVISLLIVHSNTQQQLEQLDGFEQHEHNAHVVRRNDDPCAPARYTKTHLTTAIIATIFTTLIFIMFLAVGVKYAFRWERNQDIGCFVYATFLSLYVFLLIYHLLKYFLSLQSLRLCRIKLTMHPRSFALTEKDRDLLQEMWDQWWRTKWNTIVIIWIKYVCTIAHTIPTIFSLYLFSLSLFLFTFNFSANTTVIIMTIPFAISILVSYNQKRFGSSHVLRCE